MARSLYQLVHKINLCHNNRSIKSGSFMTIQNYDNLLKSEIEFENS